MLDRTRPALLAVAFLAACSGGKGNDGDLVFEDANNYDFSAVFAADAIEVQSQSDLTIDWSALTTDVRGRPVVPADIEKVSLLNVSAPLNDVIDMIANNDLGQDVTQDVYLYDNDGSTSCYLSDFSITSIPIDLSLLTEDANSTWVLSLLNQPGGEFGSNVRTDILHTLFLVPQDAGTNTDVAFVDGISSLDVTVDIAGAAAIPTTADADTYSLSWKDVTVDTFGHPFQPELADELIIGHFDGTVADVEADFLRLDETPELYRVDVLGSTKLDDLSTALDSSGNAFGGFTADGTWLVGIICSKCATPVPLILAHVDVQ
ncbi:MAG: hypothetical protein R3F59_16185 [Myxococcota bacterium]